jgi:hypothetical protein
MAAVVEQLVQILDGHFVLVIGESQDGIHEEVQEACVGLGMKHVATFVRRIVNQAFFAKAVKNEFVYVFGTRRSAHLSSY